MKKINKILSLVMAVLFMCLSMVYVSAGDIIDGVETVIYDEFDIIVVTNEDEIEPLAAVRCDNYWNGQPYNAKKVSDSYLIQNGIDPHDLKKEALNPNADISLYNIYKDKNGGLWLYSGSGLYVPTYTYI